MNKLFLLTNYIYKKNYKYKGKFIRNRRFLIEMKLFITFILSLFLPTLSLYNVSYLRSLEKMEEEKIINKYVNIALYKIEDMIITYAKNGYNEISINDCNYNYNLIDYDIIKYNDLTPKNYNYLKPMIIENIKNNIKEELCNDCIINEQKINNCIIYKLLW